MEGVQQHSSHVYECTWQVCDCLPKMFLQSQKLKLLENGVNECIQ